MTIKLRNAAAAATPDDRAIAAFTHGPVVQAVLSPLLDARLKFLLGLFERGVLATREVRPDHGVSVDAVPAVEIGFVGVINRGSAGAIR